jgi:hypothetical protein
MKEIIKEQFYCLVEPDGNVQFATIGEDEEDVIGFVDYLACKGISPNYEDLIKLGYTLQEIKLTITKP